MPVRERSWIRGPDDVDREIKRLRSEKGIVLPQGRDACIILLKQCKKEGRQFKITAKQTSPEWTWHYEMI